MAKWRIIKNKKGILGISLDSIGSWIQGITSILPPPVKFLLFLFLLVTLTYILSIVFSAFGIFCNSAEQPVKLNPNLFTSVSLIGEIPDPKELGKEQLNLEESGFTIISEQVTECSMEVQHGYYIKEDGTLINFTAPRFFYDGTFCTDCEKVKVFDTVTGRVGGFTKKWCLGNTYRVEDKSLIKKNLCGSLSCEPPQHYFYRYPNNAYLCADNSCTTITLGQRWDELLSSKGATLMYPSARNVRNPSGDNALGITCSDLRPRMAIYGIDLFTYSTWLVLTLIVILLWAFNEIRK